MATKDGRVQIWYADGSGNVTGYTESVGDIVDAIISDYNEHFGTDIGLWTPETETLQVGGTIPNWDAYEKISNIIYIKRNGPAIAGYIKDETGFIYTNNNLCYIFDFQSGEVQNATGPELNDNFKNAVIGWASAAGLTISQVEPKEENFEIGQSMQNWNDYVTI